MKKAQVYSVQVIRLDDEEEQRDKVSGTLWTRSWINRRKSEGAFYTIFHKLMKKNCDDSKGLLLLRLLNLVNGMIVRRKCFKMWRHKSFSPNYR